MASVRKESWEKRKRRVRARVHGTSERPRLCVYRSLKHMYAQIVDDETGQTLLTVSTLSKDLKVELASKGGNIEAARKVGALVAKRALSKEIRKVVFDRNGFLFHGRVRAVAEAARDAGLEF